MASLPASRPAAPVTPGKWLVAASVMFGTVLSVMDVSIVNVAMPYMMGSFGQDLLTITWVSTAYSIAEMIMITMTAWWSTLLGRKRLFVASMLLFTGGSVMAGTAETFHQMLFWRVMQGAGGGSLIPCSQAILRETFPPAEQGMAMAVYSMGVVLAPAAGPVVGGWLVDSYGWRWIFYINVPFCIVGILMVMAFVQDPSYLKRGLTRIDWGGIALLATAIVAMQIVLERGQEVDWFSSHWIVAGTIIAICAAVALVILELSIKEPIIDFRQFRNRELTVGSALGALLGFVLYGSTFLLPQFTQDLLGYDAYQAGLVLMPRALVMLLLMPIVGRIYNIVNLRALVFVGLAILAYSQWELAHFTLDVSFWTFLMPLLALGIGLGMTLVPLNTVSLSTVPRPSMTSASALYTLTRRISGNVAYAMLATVIARRSQLHQSQLVHSINPANLIYRGAQQHFAARLIQFGYSPAGANHHALGLVNQMLSLQTQVMAYNDANWLTMAMALMVIPLVILLPRRAPLGGARSVGH